MQPDGDRSFLRRRSAQVEGDRTVALLHRVIRERLDGEPLGAGALQRRRHVGLIARFRFPVGDLHPLVHELLVEVEAGRQGGTAQGEESVLLRDPYDQLLRAVGQRDAARAFRAVVLRDGDAHRLLGLPVTRTLCGRAADPRVAGRYAPASVRQYEQFLRRVEIGKRERVVAPLQEDGLVVLAGCAEDDGRQAQ